MSRFKKLDRVRVKFGIDRGHYGTITHDEGNGYYGVKLDCHDKEMGFSEYELDFVERNYHMASAAQVQVFIDEHHKRCVTALQQIALLADTESDLHKKRFCPNGEGDGTPSGWRVAEAMREIANDVIGNVPLQVGNVKSEQERSE